MNSNTFQIQGDMPYNNALLLLIVADIFYLSPRIILVYYLSSYYIFKCSWVKTVMEMPEILFRILLCSQTRLDTGTQEVTLPLV